MLKSLKIKKSFWIYAAVALPFIFLAIRYSLSDNLKVYDAPGHVTAVWYLKNYLWPSFSGWNPFNLLGYDQGLLYPVLFHYLGATLSFIFGVEWSIKILLGIALILLPLSVYFFLGSLFQKNKEKLLIGSFILLGFLVFPGYWGANFKALAELGLLPSFFSLPLLFFYLGFLPKIAKEKFLWPTFFLVLIMLTHIVAFLVAFVCLTAIILVKIKFKELNKYYFVHMLLTLLLTSFFWVPFLTNTSFLSSSVHLSSMGFVNVSCFFAAAFLIFIFHKTKKLFLLSFSVSVFFLSLATSSDYLIEKFARESFIYDKIYALHIYRYQIYEYLLLIPLLLYWPIEFLFNLKKPKIKSEIVAVLPFLALVFLIIFRTGNYFLDGKVSVKQVKSTGGRFLETFTRAQSYPFIYTSQNQLVEKNQPWAYGLFTDADPNGPFIGSLIKSLSIDSSKETPGAFIETKIVSRDRIPDYLNLFAVENLEYIDYSKSTSNNAISFFTLKVKEQSLIEIPTLKIEKVAKNWDRQLTNWWLEKGKLSNLLVYDPRDKLELPQVASAKAALVSHSKNYSSFAINVSETKNPVPVLIKFSYFPGWSAYQEGKKIPIYQASPNLMLVLAKGSVKFVYEKTWYQNLTLIISLVTLFGIIAYRLKNYAKNKN